MNAKGTIYKKRANKSISQPKQAIKEGCEGEGNQSYIIDQKFRRSKKQNQYQNLEEMSSPVSLSSFLSVNC